MKVVKEGDPEKARVVNAQVEAFERRRPHYERLTNELATLLKRLLDQANIKVVIESRTKDIGSFREKLWRKSYDDPFAQMTDLSGIRIIVNSLEDQTRAALLIQREFAVDQERSVNKRKELPANQFGYLSRHFIVKTSLNRRNLPEWRDLKELPAEIQLRTALQHAWATIEHGLNYKSNATMTSDMKRDLFRLSALFELADKELNSIVSSVDEIKRWGGVIELDDDALLDENILSQYVSCGRIETLEAKLQANGWELGGNDSPEVSQRCLEAAHRIGVFTLGELEWVLAQLDTRAYEILNDACAENEPDGVDPVDMVHILIVASQPELFPEEEKIQKILKDERT